MDVPGDRPTCEERKNVGRRHRPAGSHQAPRPPPCNPGRCPEGAPANDARVLTPSPGTGSEAAPSSRPGRHLLTVNGGSSSIKFALFGDDDGLERILTGSVERIGMPGSILRTKSGSASEQRAVDAPDHLAAVGVLMDWIEERGGRDAFQAVGHRVVHGGPSHREPEPITSGLLDDLRKLGPFDPEHLPEEILLAESIHRRFPDLPQVACFDTAFHQGMPRVARMLPIPRCYEEGGARRYGFHGLSYESVVGQLRALGEPSATAGRAILAHLGSGASLVALRDGRSQDTTMGFTPAGGICMGTRSGDLDPGLAWHMFRTEGMDSKRWNDMVNLQSGLLGVSETSSDMRDLLCREAQDSRAREAVDLFCYQVRKAIGSFAAALGGIDLLVFAGGVGENAPLVRERICEGLGFLGIELDPGRNFANESVVSGVAAKVATRIVRTDEESVIAATVRRVVARNQ